MVEETGIVSKVKDGMATVLVQRKSSCEGCTMAGSCEFTPEGMEIEALNPVHAREGQKVQVLMAPQEYLRGSLIVYGIPLVLFVAGAIIGKNIGEEYFRDIDSDLIAAITAFATLILSLLGIKLWSRKVESNTEYKPVIEKIIG